MNVSALLQNAAKAQPASAGGVQQKGTANVPPGMVSVAVEKTKTATVSLIKNTASTLRTLLRKSKAVFESSEVTSSTTAVAPRAAQSVTVFDLVSSPAKQALQSLYDNGILNHADPISKLFIEKLESTINASGSPEFGETLIQNLAKGSYEDAVMVQNFSPENRLALRDLVKSIGKLGEKNGVETNIDIRHTLAQTAELLSHELSSSLGVRSLSSLVFDAKTVKALMSKAGDQAGHYTVLFGNLMALQHSLLSGEDQLKTPLAATLKEAGITLTSDQVTLFFNQGIKNEKELDKTLLATQNLATQLVKNDTLKGLLREVLTDRVDILSIHYQRMASAKLLGLTGTSDEQLSMMKSQLGKGLDLTSQKVHGFDGKVGGGLRSALVSLSKRTGITELKKFSQGEGSSDFKSITQLKALIHLAILDVVAEKGDSASTIDALKSGAHHTEILEKLSNLGLTDDVFIKAGGTGLSDATGLIQNETKGFSGADSVKQWFKELRLGSEKSDKIEQREAIVNSASHTAILGQNTLTFKESLSWVEGLKDKGNIMIDFGKSTTVSLPDEAKTAQETFLAGMSIGASVETKDGNQILMQKEGSGYSITLRHETVGSLSLELGGIFGALSVEGKAGGGVLSGVKLTFDTPEKAAQFITGMRTNVVDTSHISKASALFFEKGKQFELGASATLSATAPLDAILPVSIPDLGLGLPDISAELSAGASKETRWVETRNIHTAMHTKTSETHYSLDLNGKGVSVTSVTQQHVHFDHGFLDGASMTQHVHFESALGSTLDSSFKLTVPKSVRENPALKADLDTLKSQAQEGDHFEIKWELPLEKRLEAAKHMEMGNPSKAQAILSDMKQYKPVGISLVRPHSKEVTHSQELLSGAVTLQQHQEVSQAKVVGTVEIS